MAILESANCKIPILLRDIELYKGILEGYYLSGITNEDFINEKGLMIGDYVIIRKAGDIIPEVVRPLIERRDGTQIPFKMIETCPDCGQKLEKVDAMHFCLNSDCPSRKIESLIHFCDRKAMNIEGLGERIIEDFYNMKFITSIIDIYNIKAPINIDNALRSIGTLGGGNHFIEIDRDSDNYLWLVIHTGSRHTGLEVCNYYQNLAYENLKDNKDLRNQLIEKLKSEGREKEISSALKEFSKENSTHIPKMLAYCEGNLFND